MKVDRYLFRDDETGTNRKRTGDSKCKANVFVLYHGIGDTEKVRAGKKGSSPYDGQQ